MSHMLTLVYSTIKEIKTGTFKKCTNFQKISEYFRYIIILFPTSDEEIAYFLIFFLYQVQAFRSAFLFVPYIKKITSTS